MTLVELAVTVAIAAILAAIAVPNMRDFLTGRAVDTQAEELVTSLRLARSEALKRGMEVSVCASANTESASPSCSGDAGWAKGWLVFYDYDVNGSMNGNDKPLRVQGVAAASKRWPAPPPPSPSTAMARSARPAPISGSNPTSPTPACGARCA